MSKVATNTLSERNQTEENKAGHENGTSSHLRNSNLSPPNSKPKSSTSSVSDGKKKMGHREVKDGVVHYKKVPTDELKKSIQFGIVHTISFSHNYPDRDILIQDFTEAVTIHFPKAGTSETPPHDFSDFRLKVYAPYGFKYLRGKCNLDEIDFMSSIGDTELKEISNPGASGSVFYKTSNDKYILKTVQYQEAEFLKTFLGGYTSELASRLMRDKTNIRVVIMNNILPSDIPIHEKYDLKGSSYKRKASKNERSKSQPTFKDLDFINEHPNGIILDDRHYDNIIGSIKTDCLVLQSFGIMDYSLLLGIHNLEKEKNNSAIEAFYEAKLKDPSSSDHRDNQNSNRPINKLTRTFNITAVPARSSKGERLLLYLGIIDILQSYKLKKKIEHAFKSMITDGSQISVCDPKYYEERFFNFISKTVFKKSKGEFRKYSRRIMAALALKASPAGKRAPQKESIINNKECDEGQTPEIDFQLRYPSQQSTNDDASNFSDIASSSKKSNSIKSQRNNPSEGGDSAIKARRDPITTIYEHYKDTPTSSSQFSSKNPSIKKNLFDDNEKPNVNNIVKSKLTATTVTVASTNDDNEYVKNITPLSPHTYKPVSPSNWRRSPLLNNDNNNNNNQINSHQHTGNSYEQHQTTQNFNGWKRVSPRTEASLKKEINNNFNYDEIEIITHL